MLASKPAIAYLKQTGHQRIRKALKDYMRINDISFAEYTTADLARDLRNGTASSWRNIGQVTIQNAKEQLREDGVA